MPILLEGSICISTSYMHHLVFGINFQIHSVSLTILVSIHFLIHLSTHLSHHHHSRHPAFLHSFIPGSKPTFSSNPSHLKFLLPTGLPHGNGTGLDLSKLKINAWFHVHSTGYNRSDWRKFVVNLKVAIGVLWCCYCWLFSASTY